MVCAYFESTCALSGFYGILLAIISYSDPMVSSITDLVMFRFPPCPFEKNVSWDMFISCASGQHAVMNVDYSSSRIVLIRHRDRHGFTVQIISILDVMPKPGFADRRTTEAVVQELEQSDINRRIEGQRAVGNLYV